MAEHGKCGRANICYDIAKATIANLTIARYRIVVCTNHAEVAKGIILNYRHMIDEIAKVRTAN